MPGAYTKPKVFNRRYFINVGTTQAPQWAEIAEGIRSRGNSISETSVDYYDMATRGVVMTETESVKVQRSFSGLRLIGDEAQDFIIDLLYQLNKRDVEYITCYDDMEGTTTHGEQGVANLTISDDGSGDANARENIAFALNIAGKPKKGKVVIDKTTNKPTFTADSV